MKPVRWLSHALENLTAREIDRSEADKTLAQPEFVASGHPPRRVFMRRYPDKLLQQEMLLCMVVEETVSEIVVVTVYKTSRISRYLKAGTP